ncbi:MAG: hypothetical protein ACPH5K_10090 [Polaribacter sp.]
MKKQFLLVLIAVFTLSPAFSQSNPNGEYWITGRVQPKKGMASEFEKAAGLKTKKYNNSQATAMVTYKVMTGPDQGKYERIQGYKSLDWFNTRMEINAAGRAYWSKNVSKYVGNYDGNVVWSRIKNLSHNWDPESKPKKHIHRLIRIVKPGKLYDFWKFANRIVEVYKKHDYTGVQAVFKVTSGGNENKMIFVDAFDDFTDQGKFPNTDKSLKELYNEMYNGSYDEDIEVYNNALEMWGRQNEQLTLIPGLSAGF